MLISEENRYHEGGFTHLDHDGDKLVSVSVNEFVAWDFTNGEKFCILGTAKSEQSTLRYIYQGFISHLPLTENRLKFFDRTNLTNNYESNYIW